MATNKNQHYVPRCYLRPFCAYGNEAAIALFNIDREKYVACAALKHQCSGDYFYGNDPRLENAITTTEISYATVLRKILSDSYLLSDDHKSVLRMFWLFQSIRTEAAARKIVEMTEAIGSISDIQAEEFNLGIREAVLHATELFRRNMHQMDDMKICLIRNRTNTAFVTSDDPAVLANRWYVKDNRAKDQSYGHDAAGNLMILPVAPNILCLGYDGDVYSVHHRNGWLDTTSEEDVHSLNQHQYLNCRANIFCVDEQNSIVAAEQYKKYKTLRVKNRFQISYSVLESTTREYRTYRAVSRDEAMRHGDSVTQTRSVQPIPNAWPKFIRWRSNGKVYFNGSAVGYIRETATHNDTNENNVPFRKYKA